MTELDKIGVGREKTGEEKLRVALTRYEAGNTREPAEAGS